MKQFRVECNFGCKYFDDAAEALRILKSARKRTEMSVSGVFVMILREILKGFQLFKNF